MLFKMHISLYHEGSRSSFFGSEMSINFCFFHSVGKTLSFKHAINTGAKVFDAIPVANLTTMFGMLSKPKALLALMFLDA